MITSIAMSERRIAPAMPQIGVQTTRLTRMTKGRTLSELPIPHRLDEARGVCPARPRDVLATEFLGRWGPDAGSDAGSVGHGDGEAPEARCAAQGGGDREPVACRVQ